LSTLLVPKTSDPSVLMPLLHEDLRWWNKQRAAPHWAQTKKAATAAGKGAGD